MYDVFLRGLNVSSDKYKLRPFHSMSVVWHLLISIIKYTVHALFIAAAHEFVFSSRIVQHYSKDPLLAHKCQLSIP